ncbi:SDR family NAD(P)-dependent oxidoreductase [Geodermatophilus obscurus]|uniref:SDR family NAD(P)-dependent oxidoreductase n=1 Tax=Geodermatophilus obscurus TaxID=1861 RepID=UPI00019B707A|nr:SDR family NAD(P)-dependent oxidoreductase [Geodermatophilus obscurus]
MAVEPDYGEETYRGSGRLEGKRALITGGDSGIGRAVALAYAREGADVVLSYLPEEEDAQVTARVVRDAGRTAVTAPGDIRDEAFCRELVEWTVSELGGLDVLVSNAAYQMTIEDLSTEQLLRTYYTNVFATFWLCKAAVAHLQPGSSIIITTSIQAYQPSPALLDYASTKGALVNFTKGLSQELAPRGIRVNTVAPGPIWTPLISATMPAEKVGSFGAETPSAAPVNLRSWPLPTSSRRPRSRATSPGSGSASPAGCRCPEPIRRRKARRGLSLLVAESGPRGVRRWLDPPDRRCPQGPGGRRTDMVDRPSSARQSTPRTLSAEARSRVKTRAQLGGHAEELVGTWSG